MLEIEFHTHATQQIKLSSSHTGAGDDSCLQECFWWFTALSYVDLKTVITAVCQMLWIVAALRFQPCGIWWRVVGWVVPDLSVHYGVLVFSAKKPNKPAWWPLKMKALWSFEMLGTSCAMTLCLSHSTSLESLCHIICCHSIMPHSTELTLAEECQL